MTPQWLQPGAATTKESDQLLKIETSDGGKDPDIWCESEATKREQFKLSTG